MMKTRFEFNVRGYELDSFGHVNNAVYLNYLEQARWEMFLENEEWGAFLKKNEVFPAVIENRIRYLRELTPFAKAYAETLWKRRGAYLIAHHKIYNQETQKLSAVAECMLLLLSRERIIYEPPESMKNMLEEE